MKVINLLFILIFSTFCQLETLAQKGMSRYELLSDKSKIQWSSTRGEEKYRGDMKIKSGYIELNEEELVSLVVFANVQSITCVDCQDQDEAKKIMDFVKSEKFFDSDRVDYAAFKMYQSEFVEKSKEGLKYRIQGVLTIKGYSNEITLPITISTKKDRIQGSGKVSLNRTLWKLDNPEGVEGQVFMDAVVQLNINLQGETKD